MLKKVLLIYIAVWVALAGLSVARYVSIWKGTCYFQTVGWLMCTPELNTISRIGLALGVITMFTVFLLTAWMLWKHKDQLADLSPGIKKLLLVAGICAVFVLPLGMSDWPYYFSAGKAVSSGINSYVNEWTHQVDFSYPPVQFKLATFSYGPIMATVFKWLYRLSAGQAAIFLLIWKFIMLLTLYAVGFMTIKLIKLFSQTQNAAAYYLFLFAQPLFLFEWVVNVHFDGLWLLFLLFAIYAAHTKRWWLVLPALTIGVWIKYLPVLCAPFFVLWWWQDVSKQNWKKLVLEMLLGIIISILITVFSWGSFWAGLQVFSSLVIQSKWAAWSLFAAIYFSFKPLFVWVLADRAHWYLTRLVQGSLVLVLLYLLYPIIKKCVFLLLKKDKWESVEYIQAILIFFLVYLLVWQKSFTPWYCVWFIPLGVIIFEKYKSLALLKILAWLSSVSFIFHIVFISDWISQDPGAGGQLWFNYVVVGGVVIYPLYLIFLWRQKSFSNFGQSAPAKLENTGV